METDRQADTQRWSEIDRERRGEWDRKTETSKCSRRWNGGSTWKLTERCLETNRDCLPFTKISMTSRSIYVLYTYSVASRNRSQRMPWHPPQIGYWQGCRILLEKFWCSTQIIIDWLRFLATAVFISVTVTIMLNADINVSLDFTALWLLSLLISCWI